ncbi:MAG: LacI family DNA-binding transcriptional regulator [Verrucomicrobia bacterium]|nr:LacI family DNA-binding transcriptional regulator [Verrucomicrobiota bacterium]
MVRLVDIARRVGVSVMTVSKALRDQRDVSDSTRSKIKKVAAEMGYVPDSGAQLLRTNKSKLIGLVIPTTTNPVFARMVFAIEQRARELGYDILLTHTQNHSEIEETCIRRLLSRRVEGLLIAPVYRMESSVRIYKELLVRKVPVVLLGSPAAFCSQFVCAQSDDIQASFLATKHLLDLGHRRIAYFTGPLAAPWAQERFEGHRRAMRDAGLDVDDHMVFHAGATIEDGTKAALQMINEHCNATAVLAVNDMVAIGCGVTLLQQGVNIPLDISLVGFGNVLVSEYFRVPLTTIRQPKFRLGVAACDMLMQLIRGESVQSKRLSAELEIRASTAPPQKH